jgi:hypothetical protein
MKYDPIKQLNRENEMRMLKPLVTIVLGVLLVAPFLVAIILSFKDAIDAFSMRHPVILAFCFLVPGGIGWYIYGKRNNLW